MISLILFSRNLAKKGRYVTIIQGSACQFYFSRGSLIPKPVFTTKYYPMSSPGDTEAAHGQICYIIPNRKWWRPVSRDWPADLWPLTSDICRHVCLLRQFRGCSFNERDRTNYSVIILKIGWTDKNNFQGLRWYLNCVSAKGSFGKTLVNQSD